MWRALNVARVRLSVTHPQSLLCTRRLGKHVACVSVMPGYVRRPFSVGRISYSMESAVHSLKESNESQHTINDEHIRKVRASAREDGTRISNLGIQLLAPDLWEQVFGKEGRPADEFDERNIDIAIEHLKQQKIWGKPAEPVPNTSLKLPPLEGKSIDEHFQNIGRWYAEPYLSMAKQFANLDEAPPIPKRWHYKSGWTRYASDGTYTEVPHPTEDVFVFDVETLVTESKHAVLACAMSEKAWYSWVSPWLTGESPRSEHLIPLGGGPDADPRLVIGHYISYDRARVKDEYSIRETRTAFLDTMSLHVAVSGLCTQQRSGWVKFSKAIQENDDEYIQQNMPMMKYYDVSSVNSLKEVAKFHCQADIDKSARNIFVDGSLSDVRTSFQDLMIYCALDVLVTQKVYRKVFRMFLEKCPHPISFAGLIQMGRNFLTVNEKWTDYIANSERTYRELSNRIEQKLYELAQAALQEKDPMNDPWLRQLDWTIEPQKFTKPKYKKDGTYAKGGEPRPIARQFMPGYPLWYRDLCDRKTKMPRLTTRTRVAPLLLKLKWNGYPLYYSKLHGWTFRVPKSDNFNTKLKPLRFPPPKPEDIANAKSSEGQVDKLDQLTEFTEKFASGEYVPLKAEEIDMLADAEFEPIPWYDTEANYYRIPHKDGEEARCGNPLAKGYISALEDGILSSEFPLAREALEMNASCSYWISVRERVRSQFVVWEENTPPEIQEKFQQRLDELQNMPSLADKQNGKNDGKVEKFDVPPVRGSFGVNYGLPSRGPGTAYGMILPQIATMGTITRRAVEPTWMTASNAKKNRVGSELKTTVQAPPGYCIVGADVDSEELWISSLIGDAQFRAHGATAFGWMTLQGSKSAGTDMHSKTASILGISRDHAKVFNYGRIYGAGLKFATQLLLQFNQEIPEAEARRRAEDLYAATKGNKYRTSSVFGRPFWHGGSESYVFNALEQIATSESPRTPVLGCAITDALRPEYADDQFMTSRVNWVVQSSGVDYLHLLIISMAYLIEKYSIQARFMLSVHDEVRYLVKEEDRYRAALALQISNLWTRAIFSYKLGINDLPQSVAFFSCIDIDHILRKEVDMPCVTPSNPIPVPPGEKVTIEDLLRKPNALLERPGIQVKEDLIKNIPSIPVELKEIEDLKPKKSVKIKTSSELNEFDRALKTATETTGQRTNLTEAEMHTLYLRAQQYSHVTELHDFMSKEGLLFSKKSSRKGTKRSSKSSSSRKQDTDLGLSTLGTAKSAGAAMTRRAHNTSSGEHAEETTPEEDIDFADDASLLSDTQDTTIPRATDLITRKKSKQRRSATRQSKKSGSSSIVSRIP